MTMPRARLAPASGRTLRADTTGSTVIELAIVLPVMLMLILGSIEFGLNVYLRAVLEGAMQQSGRNSSLQTAQSGQNAIDAFVRSRVQAILPSATVTFDRQNYSTFSNVGRPEDFTDTNANGSHDSTECFQDMNGNGAWDSDAGRNGLGGANDVVEYTATVTYNSVIPGASTVFRLSPTTTIRATTMLRNQPFATQPSWNTVQVCP